MDKNGPANTPVLLVEDNACDEELTIRALRKSKLTNPVEVARDGEEALEMLLGRPGAPLPQVVLLDLNLPKIGGLEVLRRIRANERTRLLPVVILTSVKDDEERLASFELGCNSFVRKPVEFLQFAEAVGKLGCYWLLLNESPDDIGREGADGTGERD